MNSASDIRKEKRKNAVCVFVASSDATRDVVSTVSPSFEKHWPDCPFPLYVGINSPVQGLPSRFQAVYAPADRWQNELCRQLVQLPPGITHILLFLDDFLILSPVDTRRVMFLVDRGVEDKISYLRLIPPSRALCPAIGKKMISFFNPVLYERIRDRAPYYSSLQVALWERAHLLDTLGLAQDIWDFEHICRAGDPHYAIVKHPPIRYRHTVEKGEWMADAGSLFRSSGLPFDPSGRGSRPPADRIRFLLNRVKFALIGYAVFRFKRKMRNNRDR